MPSSEVRRLSLFYPGDFIYSFLIGGVIGMMIESGFPPDVSQRGSWVAFGVGGLVVVGLLFWSRWSRAKKLGA